jgi:hypothetical protein
MYGLVEMTNAEIVAAGGVFLREETYASDHYGGWITDKVYLLDGEEVASDRDWTFTNF